MIRSLRGRGRAPLGRWRQGPILLTMVVVFVLVLARPADATWSLVAVDPATGEVGVAMASCGAAAALGDADETLAPMVLAPGNGAGVVQGTVRPSAIEEMETLLAAGTFSASGIVQTLVEAEEDDSLSAVRQYAVVVLDDSSGQAGLHSGDETAPASLALAVDEATAQGVRLVDRTVIEEALAAYVSSRSAGRPLADALVDGLVAGAEAGGDVDCGSQTALFAQLAVAGPSDVDGRAPSTLLTVTVDKDDGQNPVKLLAQAHGRGERGWIDAGLRSPAFLPRWLVLIVGLSMAVASLVVIRRGMRMG